MLERCSEISGGTPLDLKADWSQMLLFLGGQQGSPLRVCAAHNLR
jgi:hypothetical protein